MQESLPIEKLEGTYYVVFRSTTIETAADLRYLADKLDELNTLAKSKEKAQ